MNYIEALQRRYSVKKFDNQRIIPQETLLNILQAGKLSASSLGLQPYRMLIIESKEVKEKLIPAYYNPSQVSTCSHLIVLIAKKNIEDHYIDGYFKHISLVREQNLENLQPFRNSITQFVGGLMSDTSLQWAEKQAYIVLGNLMFASAMEQVDSCPMEGFKQEIIDEILEIDVLKEKVSVTLALGYRAEDDLFQKMKKVRKPDEKIFKFL